MRRALIAGLYAITDASLIAPERLTERVHQVIKGGASVIQYRAKQTDPALRRQQAQQLRELCLASGIPLIINDDAELALAAQAEGVHLGRDDADLPTARRILGPQAIIGISCYDSLERAQAAQALGADYVAFGSFFSSLTKPAAVRADLDLLRQARAMLRIPIVAIGGITPENAPALLAAGADALAVIHGLFAQPDAEIAARRYAALFRSPILLPS
jgi:thiamine-phosphate pyrophosphorylase